MIYKTIIFFVILFIFEGELIAKEKARLIKLSDIAGKKYDLEDLLKKGPVLVDFWAPWCGPCRTIAPIVEELGNIYNGKLKVMKMNVDDNTKTPGKFGIRGIPTLILFKGGSVAEQIVGVVPKTQIEAAIQKVL